MTSPDVFPRRFVLFSASVLGWIVWLSYALKLVFDAEISDGWIVVGILFSLMAFGLILMLKGVIEAVEGLKVRKQHLQRDPPTIARPEKSKPIQKAAPPKKVVRRTTRAAYRIALGLKPRISGANRRRTRLLSFGRVHRRQSA